ncbi:MAG: PaaI family thioesterase [Burkholderiaceae bacterium]|nr:PaaI family thioesterase [Burkholderiaceae bacterium]
MPEAGLNPHLETTTPAAILLGRRLLGVDAGTGEVRMGFTARDEFTNRHGTVHGGFLSAMLDSAAANAVHATLGPGMQALTMRLDTHFHKPAPLGEFHSAARVIERDERSVLVEADLFAADGTRVASAQVRFRVRPKR